MVSSKHFQVDNVSQCFLQASLKLCSLFFENWGLLFWSSSWIRNFSWLRIPKKNLLQLKNGVQKGGYYIVMDA